LRTYSTSTFEVRIDDGLLEMRTEGVRTSKHGREAERTFESLFKSAPVTAVAFDIRASNYAITAVELESRIRQIGRQCRNIPLAFIGRDDQAEQIRLAVSTIERMHGTARGFRSRDKARAWLNTMRQPA